MTSIPRLTLTWLTLCALMAGAVHGAPTTSPATNPSHSADWWDGYFRGWKDAGGVVVLPPPPAPIDLAPLIAAAKDGQTISLVKGQYFLTTLCIVDKQLTILGNGSTLTCPTTGGTFHPSKAHTTFDNFVVAKCAMFLDNWADSTVVSNCTLGKGQPPGSIGQFYKSGPGGTNATLLNCYCGITNTVSVYCDRNGLNILSCELAGSVGEYAVRCSDIAGQAAPTGLLIKDSKISDHNPPGKDAIGLRTRKDCKISNCQISGFIRCGQTNQPLDTPADKFCTAIIDHCTFSDPDGRSFVSVDQGATVTVTGCVYLFPQASCIAGDGQSITTTSANIQQIVAGTKVWPFYATSHGGQWVDQGGDRIVQVPK
jgi:hypothetical protein